ncbi:hypothetical protein EDD85DRAFT_788478 [Armillaria nabsnona]|nr:hypothetical protein EDD85DRAFT_788478 [Armillaria nabsnona]
MDLCQAREFANWANNKLSQAINISQMTYISYLRIFQCSEDISDSDNENDELELSDESLNCTSGLDFEDMDGGKKYIEERYALQTASKIDREMINSLLRDNPIAAANFMLTQTPTHMRNAPTLDMSGIHMYNNRNRKEDEQWFRGNNLGTYR